MNIATKMGIWMDHQNANLIEFTTEPIETKTIHSKYTYAAKDHGEGKMHSKEQHEQAEYYNALGTIIHQYESVVLFGPTEAKSELFNILNADHHFSKVKIQVMPADKMTENQQHAFVKDFFTVN